MRSTEDLTAGMGCTKHEYDSHNHDLHTAKEFKEDIDENGDVTLQNQLSTSEENGHHGLGIAKQFSHLHH